MHYAIIAAGDGSRLVSEGVLTPKPLVKIMGMPMIERLMRIFASNNAESISVIVNESMHEVKEFLNNWATEETLRQLNIFKFNLVVATTPSSMHSFYELSKIIDADQICLTTVDTVFSPHEFHNFINNVGKNFDGYFVVMRFIDDEKPLYIETDGEKITGFKDTGDYDLVSGGIYVLDTKKAFPILRNCIESGQHRMRNFQRALLENGLNIGFCIFDKILDVDHAEDIAKAEQFLSSFKKKILFIARDPRFSPNNVEKDACILNKVAQIVREKRQDLEISLISEEELSTISSLKVYSCIIGMYRRNSSILKIVSEKRSRKDSFITFNDVYGLYYINVSRKEIFEKLIENGVTIPLLHDEISQIFPPLWIKANRSDCVAKGDVAFCATKEDALTTLVKFEKEDVPKQNILFMKHLHGDLIKVYVVVDKNSNINFLRWFYPQEERYSKFGQEILNDPLQYYNFDEEKLSDISKIIEKIVNLQFFGFDAIVTKEGEIQVIDINDWPSYSKYQDEAADAIATTILSDIEAQ